MILRPLASLLLALVATAACAQAPLVLPAAPGNSAVLPIRDVESNRVEAFLLLEFPQQSSTLDRLLGGKRSSPGAGISIPLSTQRRLLTQLTLEPAQSLGVLCQGRGITATLGSLARHCRLSALDEPAVSTPLMLSRPGVRAGVQLQGRSSQLAANIGINRYAVSPSLSLPGFASQPSTGTISLLGGSVADERSLGLSGQLKLGSEGWVSIGGTWAHARLVSAADLPGANWPGEWHSRSVSLGAGLGSFGGEIINRRIQLPGQTRDYSTTGLGVTWNTPWRAKLSVGAENLSSKGKNPFGLPAGDSKRKDDEGRVPYLRYQQDL